MTARGYAAVGLFNPKNGENVGGTMRAVGIYGAALVALSGPRVKTLLKHPTDTTKAVRRVPVLLVDDLFEAVPYDCATVAVELLPDARPLPSFCHPARAFYIFGPEDGSLGRRITDRCTHTIQVPTPTGICSNLAVTVNLILYDRYQKSCF